MAKAMFSLARRVGYVDTYMNDFGPKTAVERLGKLLPRTVADRNFVAMTFSAMVRGCYAAVGQRSPPQKDARRRKASCLMSDEEQIRQLQAVYVQRTDDGDARGKSDLFADRAIYYPASSEVMAREDIYNVLASRAAGQPKDRHSKHMCGNSVIRISGDAAEAATDYVVYVRVGEGAWEISQIGRYYDRFVRQGDQWFFSENRPVKLGP